MPGLTNDDFKLLEGLRIRARSTKYPPMNAGSTRSTGEDQGLGDYLLARIPTQVGLRSFASVLSSNGRTSTDYWGCVFPQSPLAIHKSFAFQLAFIVSRQSLEVGFARGSGSAQMDNQQRRAQSQQTLEDACRRLRTVRDEPWVEELGNQLERIGFAFRRSWRAADSLALPNLRSWIDLASSSEGGQATVSKVLNT